MLTRIEISGFRNFIEFSIDLRSLVVIAGPNASGKSNFFDALLLLSRLAEHTSLAQAFHAVRGAPIDQFTAYPGGRRAEAMRFAVEAVVPCSVSDPWGDTADLTHTHLRYELKLRLRRVAGEPMRIEVAHEGLAAFRKSDSLPRLPEVPSDGFQKAHLKWGARTTPYIATEADRVVLHQDGRQGRKREYPLTDLQGTVLSAANSVTFRHAFALRGELVGLRFLQLDPVALRTPSRISPFPDANAQRIDSRGARLPAMLDRLKQLDPGLLRQLARDLRRVVPEVRSVDVREDAEERRLVVEATFDHGGPFSAALLSDGTLRLIALLALRHDPVHSGALCFEEPENGIHPSRLKGIIQMLEALASDVDGTHDARRRDGALRQLLVNTHSPGLVSVVGDPRCLYFAATERHFDPDRGGPISVTRFLEVRDELPLRERGQARRYTTRGEVRRYLESVDFQRWHEPEPVTASS